MRSKLKFDKVDENSIDIDACISYLINVELAEDGWNLQPFNAIIPIETPRQLQSGAKDELSKSLKAECLKPAAIPTYLSAKAFFVQKPSSTEEASKP